MRCAERREARRRETARRQADARRLLATLNAAEFEQRKADLMAVRCPEALLSWCLRLHTSLVGLLNAEKLPV